MVSCNFTIFNTVSAPPPKLKYSWQETVYSRSFVKLWDGTSDIVNYSGFYSDSFQFSTSHINETENTWTKATKTVVLTANYSYFSNTTIMGNVTANFNLAIYKVDVEYGSGVNLIWIAVKKGTIDMEYYLQSYAYNYSYYEKNHQTVKTEFKKYDLTTQELLSTWNTTDEIFGDVNFTNGDVYADTPYYIYRHDISEFTMPLFTTFQIYETSKKDKIAWANLFHNFLMYKDKDSNGIYSVGDDASGAPDLWSSTEFCGWLSPIAIHEQKEYINTRYGFNLVSSNLYPIDRTIDSLASTIQFTPPTNVENNVTWGIVYPDFPIDGSIMDQDKPVEEWMYFPENASYDHTSPGTFSYIFEYNILDTQADFGTTIDLPKITNASFYNAVQDYGLVIPHHNFFLSSFNIDELHMKELTVPTDKFVFESNGTVVAEFDLEPPGKENYTLSDFPNPTESLSLASKGGSLNPFVLSFSKTSMHSDNPVINLIYTLEDTIVEKQFFTIADSLYRISTQNYPLWNGEHLSHDPMLTIYFKSQSTSGAENSIPSYNLSLVICGVTLSIFYIIKKRKKFFSTTEERRDLKNE